MHASGQTRWPIVPAPLRTPASTAGTHLREALKRAFLRSDLNPFRATFTRATPRQTVRDKIVNRLVLKG
jgi:hypothetical protein